MAKITRHVSRQETQYLSAKFINAEKPGAARESCAL
jgi:hypothetical protein